MYIKKERAVAVTLALIYILSSKISAMRFRCYGEGHIYFPLFYPVMLILSLMTQCGVLNFVISSVNALTYLKCIVYHIYINILHISNISIET